MDRNEKIAEIYLKTIFKDVVFEPIKGETPDFLCDKHIAVEVRLLNQHYEENGEHIGLESTEIPLSRTLSRIYSSYKSSTPVEGWFVHHEFWRPVPSKKETQEFTERTLNNFLSNQRERIDHTFSQGSLKITISPKSLVEQNIFVMGGWIDHDSGGFVESEIIRNLEICTSEKAKKIQKNKHLFKKWWLVLIDRIGEAYTLPDMSASRDFQKFKNEFVKIVLLSPDGSANIEVK